MLSLDQLPDSVLDGISRLIGNRLKDAPLPGFGVRLELAETIAITEVPLHPTESDGDPPVFRGHWLHLLKSGGKYVGHAISTPIGPAQTDWMIEGVYRADLSKYIARTANWIEKNVVGDGVVRLLVDP